MTFFLFLDLNTQPVLYIDVIRELNFSLFPTPKRAKQSTDGKVNLRLIFLPDLMEEPRK
jgi:hypothetical protein